MKRSPVNVSVKSQSLFLKPNIFAEKPVRTSNELGYCLRAMDYVSSLIQEFFNPALSLLSSCKQSNFCVTSKLSISFVPLSNFRFVAEPTLVVRKRKY